MKPEPAFFQGRRPPLHISHRGGAALAPENTLDAFRAAEQRWRTDMLELDVHFSRDGVAWVSHDPTVDRCTDGAGAIASMSSAELERLDAGFRFTQDGMAFPFRGRGVKVPRLEEVLSGFPNLLFNLDLKVDAPGAPEALAEVLRRHPALPRICLGSEWDATSERLSELLPGACLYYPKNALAAFVITALSGESPPEDERFQVLDMPLEHEGARLIQPSLLTAARERGKWINVWTIDDPVEMRRLIAEGVGGIMTDRPDLLRAALDGA